MIWTQSKNIDRLPPTIGAVAQTVKRAWYAAKVIAQSDVITHVLANLNLAGWKSADGHFEPITSEDPIAPDSVIELVNCGCKTGCKLLRCSCRKNDICCTDLCACFYFCENTDPPMDRQVGLDKKTMLFLYLHYMPCLHAWFSTYQHTSRTTNFL